MKGTYIIPAPRLGWHPNWNCNKNKNANKNKNNNKSKKKNEPKKTKEKLRPLGDILAPQIYSIFRGAISAERYL